MISPAAQAADPCPLLRVQTSAADVATRIAAVACKENQDWFSPFIDADGRMAGPPVYEAESGQLADGTPAWRKVAAYWVESGLLAQAMGRAGASDCAYAATTQYPSPTCRSFIIDTPWSGTFVSWVMRRAGLPGFRASSGHIDYVRQAYRNPSQSPYRIQAPLSGKPAPGDLLCSVRMGRRVFGYDDLASVLSLADGGGVAMHCDIVVGSSAGLAYMIGGNVQQAVTMRLLKLDANGYFSGLPMRGANDPECAPDIADSCNANRQNWAVLLKLRPANELTGLVPAVPLLQTPSSQPGPQRCVTVSGGMQVCSPAGAASPGSESMDDPPAQGIPTDAPARQPDNG